MRILAQLFPRLAILIFCFELQSMKVVFMCSKLVRYFLRDRNNMTIDSVQFVGYNLMMRLRFYLQHVLKDLSLIFYYLFFTWQYFFHMFSPDV